MDQDAHGAAYLPVGSGDAAGLGGAVATSNALRGRRILLGVGGLVIMLLLVLLIMGIVNSFGNVKHDRIESTLMERIAALTTTATQTFIRRRAFQVVDSVQLAPVTSPFQLLYGIDDLGTGGSPSNPLAVARGWVDTAFSSTYAMDGQINYNMTILSPRCARVSAMEVLVASYNMVAPAANATKEPRLVPIVTLLLCGGPDSEPCTTRGQISKDTYVGSNIIPVATVAKYALGDADLHRALYLAIYCAEKLYSAPARADLQFAIELIQ